MYLYLAKLGLGCCKGFSLVVESGGFSRAPVGGLLLCSKAPGCTGFSSCGSPALELRLSSYMRGLRRSAACGTFLHQGSNPHLLRGQADSLPLSHQGSLLGVVLKNSCSLLKKQNTRSSLKVLHWGSLES